MKKTFSILIVVFVLVPSVFLSVPPRAHAVLPVTIDGDFSIPSITTMLKSTLSAAYNYVTSSSAASLQLKEYVLDPLAWVLSQKSLQAITGSVIGFVTGNGNGTGQPQFVQNLLGNLQGVGDNQAFAFLAQFGSQSNSPFSSAITSALRTNYLQQTSLAGFFAANKCTLSQSSPNPNAFLAGNWSQGGIAAWFALTTQGQNDPYQLYQKANGQLGSQVAAAQFARVQDYQAGNGFISWCDTSSGGSNSIQPVSITPQQTGTSADLQPVSITPQQCMNSDGTPGTVATPGSVIHDQLTKALGSGVDKLVSSDEIDEILGQLAMQLVSSVLGGSSGGLSGISQSSSESSRSMLNQYTSENPAGTTGGSNTANGSIVTLAQTTLSNITAYETAWNTVLNAAQAASSTVTQLSSTCTTESSSAQTALLYEVQPVILQAQNAIASAEKTKALAQKVLAESSSTDPGTAGALLADSQALAAAPPTATDIATAQSDAQAPGAATASPSGSLTVSGGTLVDRMNLITKNAQALQSACSLPTVFH